jgi:hypothetical protein
MGDERATMRPKRAAAQNEGGMGSRDRERIIGEYDVSASTECGDMIRTCSLQVIRLISQPIPLL